MYFKIIFFLFLIGCKSTTTPELESSPTLTKKIQSKETVKSSRTAPLLIRKMGKHGVVLGRRGMNINPFDGIDDTKNLALVRKSIAANLELLPLITTLKKRASITLTGRSRIECDELIVELSGDLSGEFDGDILVLNGRDFDPARFRKFTSTETLERLRKELKTTDFDVELYKADLTGDGRTQHIALVQGPGLEMPEFSFISVRSGDVYSKKGYQKSERLMGDSVLEMQHYVVFLGVVDLDANGTLELVVRHTEPGFHFHKLFVYEWAEGLNPILDYTWGESDCNPDFDVWPENEPAK